MATTEKKDQKGQKDQKDQKGKKGKGGGGGKAAEQARAEHAGAGQPAPPPRLRIFYEQTVRQRLAQQFNLDNPHEIPRLEKIVVNVGMGEALKQPKLLDSVVDELQVITGQRPVRTRAKKSISNFGLRQGQEIGASVTLRGARMWEFFDRFVNVAVPRIRDFRGIPSRSFDGRGNFSLGLKEQVIFPEINYDRVEQIHGLDITFVTTTEQDSLAFALLRELGMPFRGDDKPVRATA